MTSINPTPHTDQFEEIVRSDFYRIIDTFLVEAKDQDGNERSLERLNADRHLAVEALISLHEKVLHHIRRETEKGMMDKIRALPAFEEYEKEVILAILESDNSTQK